MKGFKAFKRGLICKNKQYEENTVFEELEAKICEKGMHFCPDPFDVLDYYPLVNGNGEFSDFAEVESLAEEKTDDNKKFCTTKLKIGAKLSFTGFVKACVDFCIEKTVNDMPDAKSAVPAMPPKSAVLAMPPKSAVLGITPKLKVPAMPLLFVALAIAL